uniref:Uncharacterized protein n=1 Tax=Anguilla anguilla TaxID=7936 RepID=A0A0E9T278_ANGAN
MQSFSNDNNMLKKWTSFQNCWLECGASLQNNSELA